MKSGKITQRLHKSWSLIRSILLCVLIVFFVFSTTAAIYIEADSAVSPMEQLKTRLMERIKSGWDPYSSNMTLEEYLALMELFDEGKLPLEKADKKPPQKAPPQSAPGYGDGPSFDGEMDAPGVEEDHYIARTMFMFAGVPETYMGSTPLPLEYDNSNDYEPYDPYSEKLYTVEEVEVDGEIVTKYSLDGTTYVQQENNRLYDESLVNLIKKYQFAFYDVDDRITYVMNVNDEDDPNSETFYDPYLVYEASGDQTSLAALEGKKLTSLSTNTVYIVSGKSIWVFNESNPEEVGALFEEPAGEYYCYNKQLYIWSNNALHLPTGGVETRYVKALAYYYPAGLDTYKLGYERPYADWPGIKVENRETLRVDIVDRTGLANSNNPSVSGNVVQNLFPDYSGNYVKQVTIDGVDVNVLGMLWADGKDGQPGRWVYFYLSAEGQSTEVSATTLPDDNTHKFIIQYVPNEHPVSFNIQMEDGSDVPEGITLDSVFGKNRPARTTDGSYSFDVNAPYGYETQIFIMLEMIVDNAPAGWPDTIPIMINHTGKKKDAYDAYHAAYKDFVENKLHQTLSFIESGKPVGDDNNWENYRLEYSGNDAEHEDIHQNVLNKVAERIREFNEHNEGYPLGRFPDYKAQGSSGGKLAIGTDSPFMLRMSDTFYNHNVRAPRTITAVLKPLDAPVFDAWTHVTGGIAETSGRGSSSVLEIQVDDPNPDPDNPGKKITVPYNYEDYFIYSSQQRGNAADYGTAGKTSIYTGYDIKNYPGNIHTGDGWGWSEKADTAATLATMKQQADGTYSWTWTFQGNSGNFFMDMLAINGVSMKIPFFPKYSTRKGDVSTTEEPNLQNSYWTTQEFLGGMVVTVEFLVEFGNTQRVYRMTVEKARYNVTITGMNLNQYDTGAREFITYSLAGVYHGGNEGNQSDNGIEFYYRDRDNPPPPNGYTWMQVAETEVIVDSIVFDGDSNPNDADGKSYYGANIRFKIAEGYGNPYYIWHISKGTPIPDGSGGYQTSVQTDESGNLLKDGENYQYNDTLDFPVTGKELISETEDSVLVDGKLRPQYIYYNSEDGYYYIRVTNQKNPENNRDYTIALLTIEARTIQYAVRYVPVGDVKDDDGNVVDTVKGGYYYDAEHEKFERVDFVPTDMPTFQHTGGVFAPDIADQYDDNGGKYYNLLQYNMATIPATDYGTIRPLDPSGDYSFVEWILVDRDYKPIVIDGEYFHYLGGAIDIKAISEYAVKYVEGSQGVRDTLVIRLMPLWKKVSHPYTYNVILNWVDATGVIHRQDFSDYWNQVLLDFEQEQVYVYLNKNAKPFFNWIAQHPTYHFWNDVNNAIADWQIEEALCKYLEKDKLDTDYDSQDQKILRELKRVDYTGKDEEGNDVSPGEWIEGEDGERIYIPGDGNGHADFERRGNDIFTVLENGGTICIWMYEIRGGLIFHKEVQEEAYSVDEEFYFTITVEVGEEEKGLTGNYRAYPEAQFRDNRGQAYFADPDGEFATNDDGSYVAVDENGNPIKVKLISDSDAWLVHFVNGVIKRMEKNGVIQQDEHGEVTYFTVRHGQGIQLYVPAGTYTVIELGSMSGYDYKVDVVCLDTEGDVFTKPGWSVPNESDPWLKGNRREVSSDSNVSQVSATVDFVIGEHDVVETIIFYNYTTSVSVEKTVDLRGKKDENGNEWTDAQKKKYIDETSFTFTVTLTLPKDETPFIDENGQYYFNVNFYRVGDDGKIVPSTMPVVFTRPENYDASKDGNVWVCEFELKHSESAVVVMKVLDGKVTYSVEELSGHGLYPHWTRKSGEAKAGQKTIVKVINNTVNEYGYLAIRMLDGQTHESFLFKITDEGGNEIIVSVKGKGITYIYVPLGTYTVEEISGWAWRYEPASATNKNGATATDGKVTVKITEAHKKRTKALELEYSCDLKNKPWLGGENSTQNSFAP